MISTITDNMRDRNQNANDINLLADCKLRHHILPSSLSQSHFIHNHNSHVIFCHTKSTSNNLTLSPIHMWHEAVMQSQLVALMSRQRGAGPGLAAVHSLCYNCVSVADHLAQPEMHRQ